MAQIQNPGANQVSQAGQGAQSLAQAVGQAVGGGGGGQTPPILPDQQGQQSIPQGPVLQQVQPGDLITAQYVNNLVLAVQNLQARVAELEEPSDGSEFSAS